MQSFLTFTFYIIANEKISIPNGAGISAESGIRTFRDSGGLWEDHNVTDVASPEGWMRNKGACARVYNEQRRQLEIPA